MRSAQPNDATDLARNLRQRSTDAERKLWAHLRGRRMGGVKFRRQHPIGQYIVDFVSNEVGLVIEVDGGHHLESEADVARDAWLKSQGYQILRFWNHEVLAHTQSVVERIRMELECPHTTSDGAEPSPRPSPKVERGEQGET
ncbi:endonuclease domain-containing protein [Candidatus Fermentibacteria bacterium]|nr:endonuclease domain-containing protein [Candidatus Fermentibacteria bacterium]